MNMNELVTASRYNIPIIQVVMNNSVLGMVHQWQELFYGGRYSHTILKDKVDYCKLAEALGCAAFRVTKREEFAPAFKKAIELGCPVLLDCVIGENDNVYPMVPAGHAISEAFDQDDLGGRKSSGARTRKKDEI
jgi:acetolactate synthase-1/2/3 large subunit